MSSLDSISVWIVGLLIVLALSILIEIGFQVGRHFAGERDLNKHPVEASVTTALLGLLAFMLGFAFAAGATKYGRLRAIATDDANTAGTLFLRADLLPENQIQPARDLIHEYVRIRVEVTRDPTKERLNQAIARSAEIQKQLWTIAMEARRQSDSPTLNLFITALNDLIDNDTVRQTTALSTRFPFMLWFTLCFLGFLSTVMLGMSSGLHGRRSRVASTALIVAFSLVFILIVDLDRPTRNLFKRGSPAEESTLRFMDEFATTPP